MIAGRLQLPIWSNFAWGTSGGIKTHCPLVAIYAKIHYAHIWQHVLRNKNFRSSWPDLLMDGNPARIIQLILIAGVGFQMSTTTIWFYAMGVGGWFHHVCAGVGESSLPDVWLCFECEQVGDDVIGRSPRYVWDPSKFVIIIWLLVCMCAFPWLRKLIVEGFNHGWQTNLYKVHLQRLLFFLGNIFYDVRLVALWVAGYVGHVMRVFFMPFVSTA